MRTRLAQGGGLERAPDLSVVVFADGRENLEVLLPAPRDTIARIGIEAEILVAGGDPKRRHG